MIPFARSRFSFYLRVQHLFPNLKRKQQIDNSLLAEVQTLDYA